MNITSLEKQFDKGYDIKKDLIKSIQLNNVSYRYMGNFQKWKCLRIRTKQENNIHIDEYILYSKYNEKVYLFSFNPIKEYSYPGINEYTLFLFAINSFDNVLSFLCQYTYLSTKYNHLEKVENEH